MNPAVAVQRTVQATSALSRRRPPGRDWVSKTDLTRFLRCPYAFLQVDRGLLSTDALIDPISHRLIDDGSEFHEQVLRTATPVPVAPRSRSYWPGVRRRTCAAPVRVDAG